MTIQNQTVKDFLDDLASSKPTPGGGAVAAITGATAAGLVEMVVNLTKGEEIKHLGEKAKELREKLLKLADEDVTAFDRVMDAYRSKDAEKIKEALNGAIVVPQQTKEYACLVEEIANIVAEKGNKNAVSDAKTAIYLAQASQKAAEENIKINKESLQKIT